MSFYIIKCKLTGLVLDIEGANCRSGAKVIPYDHNGHDNQIWYDDHSRRVICSKAGSQVLAVTNNQLCVEDYQGKPSQQWVRDGAHIRNAIDRNKVLDILDHNKEKGAKIGEYQFNGGPNQSFEFDTVPGQPPVSGGAPLAQASTAYPAYPGYPQAGGARREFYITSKLHGKVVDIVKANKDAGAKICVWDKKSPAEKNQLWYMDGQGGIRSALNDMQFSSPKSGESLHMQQNSDARSQWSFQGEKIVNHAGECLDIRGASNDKGAELCGYEYKNQKNQHWSQDFV